MELEEFLIKKKIDPALFQHSDQSLFQEFKILYGKMGSKSFDHSKKFWFNKLRRKYHLSELPKAGGEKIMEINQPADQALPQLSSSVAKNSPEKPWRKEDSPSSPHAGTESPRPYVPRFRPRTGKVADNENLPTGSERPADKRETKDDTSTKHRPEQKVQAYKPRFRPGQTGPSKE